MESSHLHEALETGMVEVPAGVRRPPAPGEEVAGPPLVHLVEQLRAVAVGMDALYRQARAEAQVRTYAGRAAFQTDANGDGATKLYEVPQGATGYLTRLAVNLGATTPAAPITSANLWHAIYEGGGGDITAAQLIALGNLLDCQPEGPAVDAQLPAVYGYGDWRTAPVLVGPKSFYFVVDAATALSPIGIAFSVLIIQPEP